MKVTLIAFTAAALAVMATPATAANVAAPVAGTHINAVEALTETAELHGKRRGATRHKRFGRFKHRGHFRGSRFHHSRRLKAKQKLHFKHHDHVVHDREIKRHRVHPHRTIKKGFKTKRIGYRGF